MKDPIDLKPTEWRSTRNNEDIRAEENSFWDAIGAIIVGACILGYKLIFG